MKLLEGYSELLPEAELLMLEQEADSQIGTRCRCGLGRCEVRCLDCKQLPLLCRPCWVLAHKYEPLHWAHVWGGHYFNRQDILTVLPHYRIPLGHLGECCPKGLTPKLMNIVDVNGVHATKVSFCGCEDDPHHRWRQLFRAHFFPASVDRPQTAFTFEIMRSWQILTFQSKITVYHFMKYLRCITDNIFTGNIPVCLHSILYFKNRC